MPNPIFGTGAQLDSPDPRDFRVSFDAATPSPVDWTNGTNCASPQPIDQGNSDCCVACACSYFHWQLEGKAFSRRDLFARIANPILGQGAEIRDGLMAIVNQGQALLADVPDPAVETDANMRDKTGITSGTELPWKEVNAFGPDNDIDSIARCILLYRGVVLGLYVSVASWFYGSMEAPDPPTSGQMQDLPNQIQLGNVLKHALYFFGYHMHDNGDGTQEKCLIGATSWKWGGTEHHIRERYFDSQATFSPWTFIPASAVSSVLQKVTLNVNGPDAGASELRTKPKGKKKLTQAVRRNGQTSAKKAAEKVLPPKKKPQKKVTAKKGKSTKNSRH